MLDRLCDNLTFGALEPCVECNGGQLVYQSGELKNFMKSYIGGQSSLAHLLNIIWEEPVMTSTVGVGYRCQGDLSEWTKCQVNLFSELRPKLPNIFRSSPWTPRGGSSRYRMSSSRNLTSWPCTRLEHQFLKMFSVFNWQSKIGTRIIPNLPGIPQAQSTNGSSNGTHSGWGALILFLICWCFFSAHPPRHFFHLRVWSLYWAGKWIRWRHRVQK